MGERHRRAGNTDGVTNPTCNTVERIAITLSPEPDEYRYVCLTTGAAYVFVTGTMHTVVKG